jgi:hypothetical protein
VTLSDIQRSNCSAISNSKLEGLAIIPGELSDHRQGIGEVG